MTLRRFRILLLLTILILVALTTWQTRTRTTAWEQPLWVVVYPIDGDEREATAAHIDGLAQPAFGGMERFMADAASRYGVGLDTPVTVKLAPEVDARPPAPPADRNVLMTAWWSLRLRFWAWRHDTYDGPRPDVRMFVVYFDPVARRRLEHSLGLRKGMVGVVNAFASTRARASNQVVIVHELLHTLGATDKYDPATNQPHYPGGYADPDREPLHPQQRAEIMGGRIPVSERRAETPGGLTQTVVGPATAAEINWIDSGDSDRPSGG